MRKVYGIVFSLVLLGGFASADSVRIANYTLTSDSGGFITTTITNLTDIIEGYSGYGQYDPNLGTEDWTSLISPVGIDPGETADAWMGYFVRQNGYGVEILLSQTIFSVGGQQYETALPSGERWPSARSPFLFMPNGEAGIFIDATPLSGGAIPEPGSLFLLATALAGVVGLRNKLRR